MSGFKDKQFSGAFYAYKKEGETVQAVIVNTENEDDVDSLESGDYYLTAEAARLAITSGDTDSFVIGRSEGKNYAVVQQFPEDTKEEPKAEDAVPTIPEKPTEPAKDASF